MSSASIHEVRCPICNTKQKIERYNSVNDYHSELFPKIVDKTIFDYTCENCGKVIREPYPLLFHKMSVNDIQIGYKITPIKLPFTNPFIELLKTTYKKDNVSERYDDINEFAKRVSEFV